MEDFLKNFDLLPRDILVIPFMAALFAFFWQLLGKTVISHHAALYEAREKNSIGAVHLAEANLAAAVGYEDQYENEIAVSRSNIMKSLEPRLAQARSEAARLIESGEAEAAALIDAVRSEIAEDEKRLSAVIESEAGILANTISERVLS